MKLRRRWYDWLLFGLALAVLLAATVYVFVVWKRLPERIPSHYNAMGQPDAYGPRSGILFLPTVAWFLFILISAVEDTRVPACSTLAAALGPRKYILCGQSCQPQQATWIHAQLGTWVWITPAVLATQVK